MLTNFQHLRCLLSIFAKMVNVKITRFSRLIGLGIPLAFYFYLPFFRRWSIKKKKVFQKREGSD